ncbi:MAG: ComEC/Rec2 family competence protein [Candidatus Peribacteraceae bacterium]
MNRAYLTAIGIGTFLSVTLLGRWIPIDEVHLWIIASTGILSLLVFLPWKRKVSLVMCAVTLGTVLGLSTIGRIHTHLAASPLADFSTNEKRTLIGTVDTIPDIRPTNNRYVLQVETIDGSPVRGRVQITDGAGAPIYEYGDRVRVEGKLRSPEAADTFDYPAYLKTQHIDALMSYASVSAEAARPLSWTSQCFRFLFRFRVALETQIQVLLPEPHASLLIGFITGSRSGLPENVNQEFRVTGTSHIVAVSGYNVTLVLAIASSLLWWMPMKRRFLPLSIGIVLYMLLTGADAPVVRASIMGLLGLLALQLGRSTIPILGLLWTAAIMTLLDPVDLWHDPGMQLSFLSVAGLILLSAPLGRMFSRVPKTLGVQDSLIATCAAQIATLPVSALTFKQLSLISPLTNILIAPFIPLAMATGMISVLVSLVTTALGLPTAYITWAFLEWILRAVHLTALVPYAQITW